ncbi:hypothetical protein RFW87_00925, partial [Acinetobacter baumannii]|nr:hypothetical protein [Acinetobacter baumannii]
MYLKILPHILSNLIHIKQQNEPQNGKDSAQLQTVVIASTGSDADIW